ncbi:phosphate transport system regulatory protein PhoU [Lachnospiraceae bacterium KM106-2]|nr:phosphate transport system regulatory protein PhoU [Lachnospiraceae bacterium KM106-2]
MRSRFDEELEQLNEELITMGSYIEHSIESAVKALSDSDIAMAKAAIAYDNEVDQKEKEIEHLCLKLLLQQQPVARDLRLISAALKMITDMERIGDQASDISEIAMYLSEGDNIMELENIAKMGKETIKMVTNSIDAFVKGDLNLAKAVIEQDDVVDHLFLEVKHELIALIRENVNYSEQATDWLMVAKYFERIGDHATNIAEWVIFSMTGKHED